MRISYWSSDVCSSDLDPDFAWSPPSDEYAPIALNYTSGTTGNPKGVVYHHRGTCLLAMSHALAWNLPPRCVYLWTLPLFHCNGWGFAWATALQGGTSVCLRKVDPALVYELIAKHGVTNMCGAPTVLSMLRSEEHTSELQSLMRISYAVFCLKKKK